LKNLLAVADLHCALAKNLYVLVLGLLQVMQLVCYGVRFVAAAVMFEIMNHVLYFHALARSGMWRRLHEAAGIRVGIGDVALTGFWTCVFVWLKV
jgi:hypothetical protein